MDFLEIAKIRQSCRKYDKNKSVEDEKLLKILEAARLAPSACNSQPYHFTVCKGELAKKVADAAMGVGINRFVDQAPVLIVISEESYNPIAAFGSKFKGNDFRSIDIGITTAYLTAEAATQGLGTCIIGWFNNDKIKEICSLKNDVRLLVTLGYPTEDETIRDKKRADIKKLVSYLD